MHFRRFFPLVGFVAMCGGSASAQQVGVASEASVLARGWAQLARGEAVASAQTASAVLASNPSSSAALSLLVDAELARGQSPAAIKAYQRWMDSRRVDDAYVLRRIARALLLESSAGAPNTASRIQALKALAEEGDIAATAALTDGVTAQRFDETRALASTGDERAIQGLLERLSSAPGDQSAIIDALAASGSRMAVPHLVRLLSDRNDVNRAAAADALGRLEASEAVTPLQRLLNDPVFFVKLKAAGALFKLNDSSGLPFLNEIAQSEHAGIRLAAARELSSQPDQNWQGLVSSLSGDPDPAVRVEAADLLAPYDTATARRVLEQLLSDDNIGIREAAAQALADRAIGDFASLRALLRSGDPRVRVTAAARILQLTR